MRGYLDVILLQWQAAFHANNFVAQDMPISAGISGSGCFYIYCLGAGVCVVGIS
jgi:hypothetical protein